MEIQDSTFGYAPLVVGAMRFGRWGAGYSKKQYHEMIEGCLALGLTDFDHADIYGDYTTEAEFGEVLKDIPSLRDQMTITTKCGIKMVSSNRPEHQIKSYDLSATHIRGSVEKSLRNFHSDYLDVLLLHRPDVMMDPYEIAEVFDRLQQEGKVLHFGVSNFTTSQFEALDTLFPLITNQVEVSVLHTEPFIDGTLSQCHLSGVQVMAWSPLGGGVLFGQSDDPRIKSIQQVGKDLCQSYNCSLDQLLLAFLLAHPADIVPVLGTAKIDRIKAAVEATEIALAKEDWYKLWQASIGIEVA